MSTVTLKNEPIQITGNLPKIGEKAPPFNLVAKDLSEKTLASFAGKKCVLNIFPSIDTATCAASVRRFNEEASKHSDTYVLCISADLPFAQSRFCGAEGLDHVHTLSTFRSADFAQSYGVKFASGPLIGLTARAVIVLDTDGTVKYAELVSEVTHEPNYIAALAAL